SPINQNPLDLGIDIVIHSATKYLGGHSDICAGAVISNIDSIKRITGRAKSLGGSLNAQTCYLLERSIKTMAIRVEQQNKNAQKIAEFLEQNSKIEKVYYPGLTSHEGHHTAKKQMRGFGGMLSFELKGEFDTIKFQKELSLIRPSMSLGGVESTICSSALTSHAVLTKEQRGHEGIKDSLLRLSVGIEEADELIGDIEQVLKKM
ncbi:MAG: PLP-dependent transferase, partial [Calditrichia bacterium]|nr:PLP-dependent transferase [Calditrichia bacterium]